MTLFDEALAGEGTDGDQDMDAAGAAGMVDDVGADGAGNGNGDGSGDNGSGDNGSGGSGGSGDDGGDGDGDGTFFDWDGEQIDYSDALLVRGRAYGSYVNTNRALPDVRDGLKPVQRRVIVAMDDLGVRADRKYAKSAKTVGHVIGTYHPHGDTAVYDAMVRMAQPWQSNLPLVDGQGNWGNLNNEAPAAAQRYTESRLSAACTEFLADLRPEVVDYEPNFDETTQMPTVLPVTFPNLLVNGSMGVGWAMACSIPPHNLAEAVSAALLVLDDPEVSVDKLMKVMPGPDLPGGGIIVNPQNLRAIYETGRGTVLVQGRIEQLPGQPVLKISELPYQVSAKSIVE
ncbi:MAG TPA: DNA gyrase subunit A, partial [Acidimicrobiales bacterium]|nr:DNA gyrase subunit A [Acidimicrobiales bacterium]